MYIHTFAVMAINWRITYILFILTILNHSVSFTHHITVRCPMHMCEIDRETNTWTIQSLVIATSDIMTVRVRELVLEARERVSM